MDVEREERIRCEMIRRALEESYLRQQQREEALCTNDILDALQELTSLPRAELERIAREVRGSSGPQGEGLFSIGCQVMFVGAPVLVFIGLSVLGIWAL